MSDIKIPTATIKISDLEWIAQTIHQGNHVDQNGTFATCPKSVCKFIVLLLIEAGIKNRVP